MIFIINLLLKYRSTLFPALAVLAISIPLSFGVFTLGKQAERLGHLTEANKQWGVAFDKMEEARELEREIAQGYQNRVSELAASSNESNRRLKTLERQNAEVKSILDTRVPDDLRRLLDGKNASSR